jgi:hypothetical protein
MAVYSECDYQDGSMQCTRPGRKPAGIRARFPGEHLAQAARAFRILREVLVGGWCRAHILPTLAHQTTCLSVNHRDVFLLVGPFSSP